MDDGTFRRGDTWAPVAAVAVAAPDRVEAVRLGRVRVDGRDSTAEILRLVRGTGGLEGLRAVLLDGMVVGGFNVIDIDRLHRALGVPVVAITRKAPDFPRIRSALRKWFPGDAGRRWRLLRRHRLLALLPPGPPVRLAIVGCRRADAARLVRKTIVRGYVPEPLRIAHLVASAGAPPARSHRAKDYGDAGRSPGGPVA